MRRFPACRSKSGRWKWKNIVRSSRRAADGLVVYQETYERNIYDKMHTAGPKKNFDWRLETAERAYAAGFRRLGIGALFGLSDWRHEAICVAAHADFYCAIAGRRRSRFRCRACVLARANFSRSRR